MSQEAQRLGESIAALLPQNLRGASLQASEPSYIRAMEEAGVPKMYLAAHMADFDSVNFGDTETVSGYFITGACGTGKTHLAAAILREWIRSHRACRVDGDRWDGAKYVPKYALNARFDTATGILLAVKAAVGSGDTGRAVDRLCRMAALVIDDYGAHRETDWSAELFYQIISHRISNCRPLIVTSNLGLGEIDSADPRMASRLGGLVVLTLAGYDRRLGTVTQSVR